MEKSRGRKAMNQRVNETVKETADKAMSQVVNEKPGSVSIIVPIFNAQQFLPDLFQALSACVFYPEDEVLLVDNGSTDESAKICQEAAKATPDIYHCLTYSEAAGSYAARNYAVKQAKGDILVFTDSDCKPIAGWLQAIRESVKPGVVIAGKIQIEIVNPGKKEGLWEHFDTIAHLNSEKNAAGNRVATANMAVLREDFEQVGLFEHRFSGGDYEWSMRAAASGKKVLFVPDAMVYHPSRKTFAEILKKEQRIAYGAGNHAKTVKQPGPVLWLKYFLKIFKVDTNMRYTKQLRAAGMDEKTLREFNRKFMRIRVEQLKFAMKGYRQTDVRKLGIK